MSATGQNPHESEPVRVEVGQTWEFRLGPNAIRYEVYEVDGDWVGLRDHRPGHDSPAALRADAGSARQLADSSDWILISGPGESL